MPKLIDKDGNELLNLQMSTDEHWTGKYWIDGKKIYEKIITWTGLSVGVSTINHSISNLNEFIDYEVTCSNGTDFYRFPVTYYSGGNSGTFYCTYFIMNVDNIPLLIIIVGQIINLKQLFVTQKNKGTSIFSYLILLKELKKERIIQMSKIKKFVGVLFTSNIKNSILLPIISKKGGAVE